MTKTSALPNLGAHLSSDGALFSLRAPSAKRVILELDGRRVPMEKGEEFWEIKVEGAREGATYTYEVDGVKGLLDPYAKAFAGAQSWVREGPYPGKGVLCQGEAFDWEGVASPNLALAELIIYELHVRAFSAQAPVEHPGTFLGLIGLIPYLQKLGVNAIELLPIFEFDSCAYERHNPNTGERLKNFWGYGSLGFFAPMSGYAYADPVGEFKTLVREMHRVGIEVILDVVYNHTGPGPLLLYQQASNYYLMSEGHHMNFSGCGNTLACNAPLTQEMIVASLRYWADEMHIDGFRFDLAAILTRGEGGEVLDDPPLIKAIREDPIISQKKLIAEAWDCGGLYQVGQFPKWGPWSEWNGPFRDGVRRFIKGEREGADRFASALLGSPSLYEKPSQSINFVTAHDGFTLHDLVSYNEKQNRANGEENRDGADHNDSWNCGVEGPSDDPKIQSLRARQKRNFLLALLTARGVPLLQMGDEVSHTKRGNNNTWCQDNPLSYFPWENQDRDLFRFVQGLIAFRQGHPILKREEEVTWHTPHFAYTLGDLLIAYNATGEKQTLELPGNHWLRIVDTALPSPHDYSKEEEAMRLDSEHPYVMEAYSAILFKGTRTLKIRP